MKTALWIIYELVFVWMIIPIRAIIFLFFQFTFLDRMDDFMWRKCKPKIYLYSNT